MEKRIPIDRVIYRSSVEFYENRIAIYDQCLERLGPKDKEERAKYELLKSDCEGALSSFKNAYEPDTKRRDTLRDIKMPKESEVK